MAPERLPPPQLNNADWLERPQTQAVFSALQREGYEARAVGGAVRNALLARPVSDVDIATTASPEEVMRLAAAAGLKAAPTGLAHGTITVIADHIPYEVTTLRKDVETYGRHAKVVFTDDWAADARRRDFTINALYCGADGTVFDPLGGYADLLAGRVRFIGDPRARIREDYLRILRFFRFTAEYALGSPDREGLLASVREREGLAQLSGERVHQELLRLLKASHALAAVEAMFEHGLLTLVVPAAPRPSLLRRLIDIERLLGLQPAPLRRLAVLAIEVREDAERLRDRLKLSTAEFSALLRASLRKPELGTATAEREAKEYLYRHGVDHYRERVLMDWARCGHPPLDTSMHALLALPDRWTAPAFPLGGGDVLAIGVPPGPSVGELLRQLENWWIDAGFPDDPDAVQLQLSRLAQVEYRSKFETPSRNS
ncbi:MAG TPA: CCA tRNA nucleotidyltransferase [Hyphomicrobiaceae bacterium]|nr:CCA tRNA nucleotidyltransferase [Hyphomicrobiaceae bacterium]